MKNILLSLVIVAVVGLAASPIFSQQKEAAPAHQGHGMGEAMQQGSMMCPIMGGAGMTGMGGMGMMGGMGGGNPAMMGQMMQMRGEMMMKMGEVMMKYGKQMHKGEAK